jgi:hypothetical protein
MTIFDKNGKEYKTFSSINPLTINQENVSGLIFHNLKFKNFILNPTTEQVHSNNLQTIVKPKLLKELEISTHNEVSQLQITEATQSSKNLYEINSDAETIKDSEILILKVIEIIEINKKDDLYGETKKEYKYGEKFFEESYLIQINDFKIQLITKNKININYIIYPYKYKNNVDTGIRNWFKITKSELYENNYLTEGILSDRSPNF